MKRGDDFDCEWNGNNASATFDVFYGESCTEKENHMFVNACWSDEAVGGVCLGIAFILMFASLAGVVKCLKAVLEGSITDIINKHIDKNLPYPFGWLTEYIYVAIGFLLTIAVQSSSIILAILTPIVGIGVISIERCYPITVGSKIGTTITGVIAAFANTGIGFRRALQAVLWKMRYIACPYPDTKFFLRIRIHIRIRSDMPFFKSKYLDNIDKNINQNI